MTLRIFLCGEGRTELGSRTGDPVHQSEDQPGVLESLLRNVSTASSRPDDARRTGPDWHVAAACEWRHVKQLQVGKGANDAKRVLKLAQKAKEANCDVLVFSRDVATKADLDRLPDDATSLRRWLDRARTALTPPRDPVADREVP